VRPVVKTTIYLPEAMKKELGRLARQRGQSEAELIRVAVERMLESDASPRPALPLFRSDDPSLAERVGELLAGFGG
jgi:Arc/MetJ-type ribon-helix-helix transcriptional regulator